MGENTEKAEEIFQQMMTIQSRNKREAGMFAESVQNIMLAYRRIISGSKDSHLRKQRALECAEALYVRTKQACILKEADENSKFKVSRQRAPAFV
jgi:hypothetical protein